MFEFELSLQEGHPTNLFCFILDIVSTPPLISGKTLNEKLYTPSNPLVKSISYRDADTREGFLNIFSCRFENGKCTVHIFGILKGIRLNCIKEISLSTFRDFEMLNERIKFILNKSKSILKTYYKDSKIKNIEHHLLTFLSDGLPATNN